MIASICFPNGAFCFYGLVFTNFKFYAIENLKTYNTSLKPFLFDNRRILPVVLRAKMC